jgi:hypothetical protein
MSNNIDIIKEKYNYSNARAKEVMDLFDPEQIKEIDEYLHGGGVGKRNHI